MFISVIFNVEYMDISSRKMWYLKNLQHCKENGWILITHEYLFKNFKEIQDNISDRFIEQFEMKRFSLDEVNNVEQYFVPDEIFDVLEIEDGGRTKMLFDLNSKSNDRLFMCLDNIFKEILKRHPEEKIDGIFHCLEGYESLRKLSKELGCPLINYSFSAFRKVHGYRQTLYFSNLHSRFWDDNECSNRYKLFLDEVRSHNIPILSNKELIALIGKEHTLPFIQLMESNPKYEIGICCECFSLVPQMFRYNEYTDDDIFYECKRLFGNDKIKVRSHAAHLIDIQVDRSEVHNDPVSTILSCKRVTAVQSQILLKSLLWNRTTVTKTHGLAFTYLCDNEYTSDNIADLKGLNYYIFGYLIPSHLMFSNKYWKWRLTNPTEVEIYTLHMETLFKSLGIDKEKILSLQEKDRFKYILETRGCDQELIDHLLSNNIINNINWDVASSQFDIITKTGTKSFWRIDTENEDGTLYSCLSTNIENVKKIEFYPLFDIAGFAKLINIKINGQEIKLDTEMKSFKYMPKNSGHYSFLIDKTLPENIKIECIWEYKSISEFLNSQYIR